MDVCVYSRISTQMCIKSTIFIAHFKIDNNLNGVFLPTSVTILYTHKNFSYTFIIKQENFMKMENNCTVVL